MKKSKIIVLLAMLLVAATMLCSCGASELSFEDITNGSAYKSTPVYQNMQEISSLHNTSLQSSSNDDLLVFADESGDYTKYLVYNQESNAIIYTVTESETSDVSITVGSSSEAEFFLVRTVTYAKKNGIIDRNDYETVTALHDMNGAQKHSVRYNTSYDVSFDLLTFGGKTFRINKSGITELSSISPLIGLPEIYYATAKYYYAEEDGMFLFYNKELKLISKYQFPGYAQMNSGIVLEEDDKVLVQYSVVADPFGDEYDVIQEDGEKKYNLYTLLIDAEDGSAKELDFDYVIGYARNLTDESRAYLGFNNEISNICEFYSIVDKRVDGDNELFGTITDKGAVSLFENVNGLAIESIELVNPNLWVVDTVADIEYLINQKGDVVGEITGADSMNEKYILAGGKVYDYTLTNVVFDYQAAGYTVERMFANSIIFENTSGELFLFKEGNTQQITSQSDNKTYYSTLGSNCYVIRDASNSDDIRFRLYNENGLELRTFSYEYNFSLDFISENMSGLLLRVTGWDSNKYRTTYTYYIIK